MAEKIIKKVAVAATDIAGQKSSRYEKMQVSFGVVEASDYEVGDTLVFSDVPSLDIIKAVVIAHADSPVTLEIYPGTDVSDAIPLVVGADPVKISYVIEYIRGTGKVGAGDAQGKVLKISLGAS